MYMCMCMCVFPSKHFLPKYSVKWNLQNLFGRNTMETEKTWITLQVKLSETMKYTSDWKVNKVNFKYKIGH